MIKELWHISKTRTEWKSVDAIGKYKSVCSMISTGTERLVASGTLDQHFESRMSVPYMDGSFTLPIKYGYSLIVKNQKGKLGHVMHPHQDAIQLDEDQIYWVDENIPATRLSLISNMETVINAIWDAHPTKDQKIAICGFGNIGSLLANTLSVHYNINPHIVEIDPYRVSKAVELGFQGDNTEEYDIIFHTTASGPALQSCIDRLSFEGKLIELSWYGSKKVSLRLGEKFHYKRLQLVSSQVSQIPGHKPKETYLSRKNLALSYLQDDSYDRLITHTFLMGESPEFYHQLRNGNQPNGLIYIIDYLKN